MIRGRYNDAYHGQTERIVSLVSPCLTCFSFCFARFSLCLSYISLYLHLFLFPYILFPIEVFTNGRSDMERANCDYHYRTPTVPVTLIKS